VAFRVKDQPDGLGRTVFVLNECPFDPAHGDPDACIMQASSGKMSAQCFHNSCAGRGWQEFKETIGKPGAEHYDPPLLPRSRRSGKAKARRGQAPANGQAMASRNGQAPTDRTMPTEPPGELDGTSCSAPPGGDPPRDDGCGPWPAPHALPEIQVNDRQLCDLTDEAMRAVHVANNPPRLFQRGGLLARLRVDPDTSAPSLEALAEAALRGHLARVARYVTVHGSQSAVTVTNVSPPIDLVRDVGSLPAWHGLPLLKAVVETPVFSAAGTLVQAPGYDPRAHLWLHLDTALAIPPVPERPTAEHIGQAKTWLQTELLGDFPFVDDASKAHALAALLLPFVRQMIDGPTPMHLLDAPVEGTGKTLLASCISDVSTGRPVEAIAEATDDEEWRKRLTAVLMEGPTLVLLDNLNRVLDSGALASVLTTRIWKDRVLGVSKTARLPNLAVWLASGNNTRLSRELIRRTVWCRLDARSDAPWERTKFRHNNLLVWAKEHRGQLIWAALVLCQAWVAAGRPDGKETLGMFENWAQTMGGILEVAGVPGLLANAKKFRQEAADKGSEWRAFVAAWWKEFRDCPVGVKDLYELVTREKMLDSVLGDKGEASQRIRLGVALGKARDRVIGSYRVRGAEEDHSQRQMYRLELVAPSGTDPQANASDTFEIVG
jgi:hypothetical protein